MKFYIRLVAGSLLVAGTAGIVQAQFFSGSLCVANAGTPNIVRVEGATELVADLLLVCRGGTPAASGQPVLLSTFTLTANTNITSRLLGGGYMDALLTIDEPYPANPITSVSPFTIAPPGNNPGQALCYSTSTAAPGSCNYLLGTGGGGYGAVTDPYLQQNAYTMYAGMQQAPNQIVFAGVPYDPPGPYPGERIIRITNIRAYATAVGLSSTLIPNQVEEYISISDHNVTINNPQQTVAFIQRGIITVDKSYPLCGCMSHNSSLLAGNGTPSFDTFVQVREGFASAFKRRNLGVTVDGPTPPLTYDQNVPGWPYNTESGFLPSPSLVASPGYTFTPADSGTRILLTFVNVPPGVHVFVPVSVTFPNSTPTASYPPENSFRTPQIQLIQTQIDGSSAPGYTAIAATASIDATPVAEASLSGSYGYATYEVVDSDPAALEIATIPIAFAFSGSSPINATIYMKQLLAPSSTVLAAADVSTPLPRFYPMAKPVPGDFDANGLSDRVWQNDSDGRVTVHYYGSGNILEGWNYLHPQTVTGWHVAAVADFNGDGIPDLVWQDDATREVTVHYYGGTGGAVYQTFAWLHSTPVPGWRVVAAADFNGDGVPDLVWQNDTTRQITVHYYGGTGGSVYQGWNYLNSTGAPGWHVTGAADFNGDGVPDLVWQNDETRQVTVHYYGGSGGAVFQNWNWLNIAGAPGWSIKSVCDVNGDSLPDLVWQNDDTRQVTVHYFNNAVFIGWDWLYQTGIPGWSIVH